MWGTRGGPRCCGQFNGHSLVIRTSIAVGAASKVTPCIDSCRSNAASLPRLRQNLNEPLGHALFPKFSILAHGCMANCRYNVSEDGQFVTVRALRHIQAGENLTIDYTDPLLGNFVSTSSSYFPKIGLMIPILSFRPAERLLLTIGTLIVAANAVQVPRKWTPICLLSDVLTKMDTFCLITLWRKGQAGGVTGVENPSQRNGLISKRPGSRKLDRKLI